MASAITESYCFLYGNFLLIPQVVKVLVIATTFQGSIFIVKYCPFISIFGARILFSKKISMVFICISERMRSNQF